MTAFGSSTNINSTNVTSETKAVTVGAARVYGIHASGPAAAGEITLTNGNGGAELFKIRKGGHLHDIVMNFPQPIYFSSSVYSAFTTEQVTSLTVLHS